MNLREYETLYILKPDLPDDQVAKINERLTGVLGREGARILRLDLWGRKKLAYDVRKNPKGLYVHLSYLSQPQVVAEFERNLRVLEPVIKFQTVRIADNVDVEERLRKQEAEDRLRAADEARRMAETQSAAAAGAGTVKRENESDESGDEMADSNFGGDNLDATQDDRRKED